MEERLAIIAEQRKAFSGYSRVLSPVFDFCIYVFSDTTLNPETKFAIFMRLRALTRRNPLYVSSVEKDIKKVTSNLAQSKENIQPVIDELTQLKTLPPHQHHPFQNADFTFPTITSVGTTTEGRATKMFDFFLQQLEILYPTPQPSAVNLFTLLPNHLRNHLIRYLFDQEHEDAVADVKSFLTSSKAFYEIYIAGDNRRLYLTQLRKKLFHDGRYNNVRMVFDICTELYVYSEALNAAKKQWLKAMQQTVLSKSSAKSNLELLNTALNNIIGNYAQLSGNSSSASLYEMTKRILRFFIIILDESKNTERNRLIMTSIQQFFRELREWRAQQSTIQSNQQLVSAAAIIAIAGVAGLITREPHVVGVILVSGLATCEAATRVLRVIPEGNFAQRLMFWSSEPRIPDLSEITLPALDNLQSITQARNT